MTKLFAAFAILCAFTQTSAEPTWEIAEGSIELSGEASATTKDAKASWKKECESWKKEFRDDNKENKIIAISCGAPTCSGEAGSKVCTSKTTYKVNTKIN